MHPTLPYPIYIHVCSIGGMRTCTLRGMYYVYNIYITPPTHPNISYVYIRHQFIHWGDVECIITYTHAQQQYTRHGIHWGDVINYVCTYQFLECGSTGAAFAVYIYIRISNYIAPVPPPPPHGTDSASLGIQSATPSTSRALSVNTQYSIQSLDPSPRGDVYEYTYIIR